MMPKYNHGYKVKFNQPLADSPFWWELGAREHYEGCFPKFCYKCRTPNTTLVLWRMMEAFISDEGKRKLRDGNYPVCAKCSEAYEIFMDDAGRVSTTIYDTVYIHKAIKIGTIDDSKRCVYRGGWIIQDDKNLSLSAGVLLSDTMSINTQCGIYNQSELEEMCTVFDQPNVIYRKRTEFAILGRSEPLKRMGGVQKRKRTRYSSGERRRGGKLIKKT